MSHDEHTAAAVLFDMDGVLVDSTTVIENAWRTACLRWGRAIDDETMREHVHGRPGAYTVDHLFPALSAEEKQRVRAEVDLIEERSDCSSIPGVEAFLASLLDLGVPVGLVTSSWQGRIDHVLGLFGLSGRFSVIVHRNDVTRGKPDPEPYRVAAERLRVPASRTVIFEDSPSGVTAAAAAGGFCVGVGGAELLRFGARAATADFTRVEVRRVDGDVIRLSVGGGLVAILRSLR